LIAIILVAAYARIYWAGASFSREIDESLALVPDHKRSIYQALE
jgi:hypothetical protein